MPGPGGRGGGGGRGGSFGGSGGGSRGGSFGGSRGGSMREPRPGSFGGGFPPPRSRPVHSPMHPMGGWHVRHSRRVYGGCCLGSMLETVLLVGIFVLFLSLYMCAGPEHSGSVEINTEDSYNETALQQYADLRYREFFGDETAYEDNLLLVFLTEDDYYNFYYIAWVGDHVEPAVRDLLGDNDSLLGQILLSRINETSYQYSLDTDLARVFSDLTSGIQGLGLARYLVCNESAASVQSHLVNDSMLPMTEDTVNSALRSFTDATGIPVIVVVEDAASVFGSEPAVSTQTSSDSHPKEQEGRVSAGSVLIVLLAVGAVAIVGFSIARKRGKVETADTR